jgi:hypothetical protein
MRLNLKYACGAIAILFSMNSQAVNTGPYNPIVLPKTGEIEQLQVDYDLVKKPEQYDYLESTISLKLSNFCGQAVRAVIREVRCDGITTNIQVVDLQQVNNQQDSCRYSAKFTGFAFRDYDDPLPNPTGKLSILIADGPNGEVVPEMNPQDGSVEFSLQYMLK